MLDYVANYRIDCGVSNGFALKDPDCIEREEIINAVDDSQAFLESIIKAKEFADGYLSNPLTGKTEVRLLSLYGSNGNVKFDKEKAVVESSELEHLLKFGEYDEEDSFNIR